MLSLFASLPLLLIQDVVGNYERLEPRSQSSGADNTADRILVGF
jgi:hypothetical protein